ncbi:MAG: hypothetical protein J6I84_02485 [Bacilli bacterium]|nr:hypothetical protein [Bacilli bacterium]
MLSDRQFSLTGTLIGNQYPFFLGNIGLGSSYFLYQINTPGLSPKCIPYFSMTKLAEKTKATEEGSDLDIISYCVGLGKKMSTKVAADFLKENILKKDGNVIEQNPSEKGFPLIELGWGNAAQKSLIQGLRDILRWRTYKFQPGNLIDVLWTAKDFIVLKICGDKDAYWFEPVAAYRNTDLEMKNPLKILDWGRINYPRERFTGNSKASAINWTLRRVERSSFDRKPFRA